MDALAVVYARELTRWGIETSIIVPGAFTSGTNHFARAGAPADKARAAEYEAAPYAGLADHVLKGFASIVPADADVSAVADAIVKVVATPFGKRPFRVHVDPTQDGAEVVNAVSDRVRAELPRRIGLDDLLPANVLRWTSGPCAPGDDLARRGSTVSLSVLGIGPQHRDAREFPLAGCRPS